MHCPCIREIPKVEEAWALESGIQLKDSGILQETESSIDKESRIQCVECHPQRGIHDPRLSWPTLRGVKCRA